MRAQITWRVRMATFMQSDVEYAPFAIKWLSGLTPVRMAVVATLCLILVFSHFWSELATAGVTGSVLIAMPGTLVRFFAAAIPLMLLILWVDRRTQDSPSMTRVAAFGWATIAGAAAYAVVHIGSDAGMLGADWRGQPTLWRVSRYFYRGALAGALLSAVLFFTGRGREAARQLLSSRLARIAAERQGAEARLQLLNAQIEPHFLFNCLASVKRLYERDPGAGKGLLRNLAIYLRAAIHHGPRETTLRDEVTLARSFLKIFEQRMGGRLRVRIDIPPDLEGAAIPSLMLGTLVENALKHGIGPRSAGGSVAIAARQEGGALIVEVSDDGLGFRDESGKGVGLANTRARLQSLYPGEGDVDLRKNSRGGVTAAIRLPLRIKNADSEPVVPSEVPAAPETPQRQRHTGVLGRFLQILSWKHWVWAIGIGLAIICLDEIESLSMPFGYSDIWTANLRAVLLSVVSSCFFMIAIVLVEAIHGDVEDRSGGRHFLGWLGAAIACCGIYSLFPDPEYEVAVRRAITVVREGLYGAWEGALGTLLYVWLRNSRRADEALERAEIERGQAERKLVESRLETVESEVDPAFLFETLDTIEASYDHDRVAADAMLDELIAFLRAAIPKLRYPAESKIMA